MEIDLAHIGMRQQNIRTSRVSRGCALPINLLATPGEWLLGIPETNRIGRKDSITPHLNPAVPTGLSSATSVFGALPRDPNAARGRGHLLGPVHMDNFLADANFDPLNRGRSDRVDLELEGRCLGSNDRTHRR